MKKAAVRTGDVDGFFARAKDAARCTDPGEPFDGRAPAIEDLISGINADNLHEEIDFGSPVGKEKR